MTAECERSSQSDQIMAGIREGHQQVDAVDPLQRAALRLKAMISDRFSASAIPDLAEVKKVYTHDLNALVALAGLATTFVLALRSTRFSANWSVVREWDEQSRYRESDLTTATALLAAISDPMDGVMAWLATC